MNEEQLLEGIKELCSRAGKTKEDAEAFYEKLKADEEICREFVFYMENGSFSCSVKVAGYTVVDILIWQMDHFKAWLDRDVSGSRENKDQMVLMAFDTFLSMKKEPDRYIQKMQYETGTDYPDKY